MLGIKFRGGLTKSGGKVYLTIAPIVGTAGAGGETHTFRLDDESCCEVDADLSGCELLEGLFLLLPAYRRLDGDATLAPGANEPHPA